MLGWHVEGDRLIGRHPEFVENSPDADFLPVFDLIPLWKVAILYLCEQIGQY